MRDPKAVLRFSDRVTGDQPVAMEAQEIMELPPAFAVAKLGMGLDEPAPGFGGTNPFMGRMHRY